MEALNHVAHEHERGFHFVGFDSREQFFSYQHVHAEALRRAAHLSALGLRKGDRLALVVSDGGEFVMSFFGAVMAGVVAVPISSPFTQKAPASYVENVARIVRAAGARMLLTTDKIRPTVQGVSELAGALERLVTVEEAFAGETPAFEPPRVRPEDLCFFQFTSGSTSSPRGVMISHANLMANVTAFMGPFGIDSRPGDVGVSWLPLFHDMGLIGFILAPLATNRQAVIISTTAFARDPRIWLRTLHKYRGSVTYAPNFAYALTAKRVRDQDLEELDLSCVRVAGCGAEPIHAPTLRSFAERLAPVGFNSDALLPSYGLAESTLAVTLHRAGAPLRTDKIDADALKWGRAAPADEQTKQVSEVVSCGDCFPDHQVVIVDEDGAVLDERRVGEILARGPSIARGYYNTPEATRATWQDGWLHTGDRGYIADGELFVCGRIKDLIIIRGANFYPHDIESAVRDLPGIRHGNVAAFGVMDGGQEKLTVIAETNGRDDSELGKLIAERVREAVGLEVHRLVFVPSGTLPKTSSGKLQRHKVKELFERGQLTAADAQARRAAPGATGQSQEISAGGAPPLLGVRQFAGDLEEQAG
ncbi:MAG TPA: fatty acyl-AMP ligase [Pyrinomonadaceae bacterium]